MAVAREGDQTPIMVREMAERYSLPATYLEQIMVPLRQSKLLASVRGARGGYRLTRPANEITLRQIVEALEGPITLVDCDEIACCGIQPDLCALNEFFSSTSRLLQGALDAVTLADITELQQQKMRQSAEMEGVTNAL